MQPVRLEVYRAKEDLMVTAQDNIHDVMWFGAGNTIARAIADYKESLTNHMNDLQSGKVKAKASLLSLQGYLAPREV